MTNIRYWITAAGGTLTAAQNFVGLYNSAGTKLAASADQTTNFGTTGLIDAAMVSGPITVTPPFVWVAVLTNGTTGPSFLKAANQTAPWANGKLAVASSAYGTILSGQTSLPASITPGSIAQASQEYWAAIW
jgi:hypothetical protein